MKQQTPKLTKIAEKTWRTVTHGYLYQSGMLALCHAQTVKPKGAPVGAECKWVTLHKLEQFPRGCSFHSGRIVLHDRALCRLVAVSYAVDASAPSVDRGSQASKAAGISIGDLAITVGENSARDTVYFHEMPGFLHAGYTFQPDARGVDDEPHAGMATWRDLAVIAA